jgi:endoglycosylceramidase
LWATITDDEPTCTPGRREDSPAVIRAWDHFYNNTDGIRDELATLWGRIAAEFANEPAVAGYDLLNEPGSASSMILTMNGLTAFYRQAEAAIRAAEAKAAAPGHIIFFEPGVDGIPSGFGLRIENSVYAAHNYFEVFNPLPLEFGFWLFDFLGMLYGSPVWNGEYNSFSDDDDWIIRYAALDDQYLQAGGAWWQWEQECGDPHNVMYPPTPEWIEQQRLNCGNARFGIQVCLDRAYPRAAPGRLTSLGAVPCDGHLTLTGNTAAPGEADLWIPSTSEDEPVVTGAGIGSIETERVNGGWRLFVMASGDYSIEVEPTEVSR